MAVTTRPVNPARFIAQSVTGEFLDWDLPLLEAKVKWARSGPGGITGTLAPEQVEIARAQIAPWGTWVHFEDSGVIRQSGIVQPGSLEGESLTVDCEGASGYLHGLVYQGKYQKTGLDPADAIRELWREAQSYVDGNLGVTVTGTTPIRIGTLRKESDPDSGPYELLWWNDTDSGDQVNELCTTHGIDYLERDQWADDAHTTVAHFIDLYYPRLNRVASSDVTFEHGVNLEAVPTLVSPADYASTVIGSGAGEGSKKVHTVSSTVVTGRLRRCRVVTDAKITKADVMKAKTDAELRRALVDRRFDQLVVKARHPAAPLGSYRCGDFITATARLAYYGDIRLSGTINAYEWEQAKELVTIDLTSSTDQAAAG